MAGQAKLGSGGQARVVLVGVDDDEKFSFGDSIDASLGWDTTDANAEAFFLELPAGTSAKVPVFVIGEGTLFGVDLGLFNGITQPTLAVIDDDQDSFIALDFSADDVSRIRTNAPLTVTASSGAITIAPATNTTFSGTAILAANAAGPALQNEAATATNPTLIPNKADPDTGVGWVGTNNLALVANGAKVLDATDGRVQFGDNAAGPQAMNETADWDNPTLIPNRADTDTGIGWASTNNMTLVAGGTGLVYVNGAFGSLGFGVAASANYKHRFGGSFTAAADPRGILMAVAVTGPSGATSIRHLYLSGSLTTTAEVGRVLARASGLEIEPLDLTLGSGTTVTAASTIYVGGAPTEGVNNYAIFSNAGLNRFNGDGSNVFELPEDDTDPTSTGGAAVGRIPVKIGGSTHYIAYY
jgi:hypothetical protein